MSNYTTLQEMFLMNISVNEGSEQSGSGIEQKLYVKTRDFLNDYGLTNWEIVWGPAVYRAIDGSTPDQVMYVGKDPATARYFVSVSGTNPYSVLNWYEDVDVKTTEKWPWNNAPQEVQVASGSMLALNILLGLKTTARVGGNPVGDAVLMSEFLHTEFADKPSGSCTIITGGHSLGGAISPLVALWLKDNESVWNANQAVKEVSSYPSAGPTPGLTGFKSYYDARIPHTTRIHNTIDVVPHAWNKQDLEAIKTLYQPDIPQSDCVDFLVDLNIDKVKGLDYVQAGLIDAPLQGTVNTSMIDKDKFAGVNFATQLGYQHVDAYFKLLKIERVDFIAMKTKAIEEQALKKIEELEKSN